MTPSQTRMAPFSAYVALVRGVLVDFGFGSLITKFEEYFGKRIAVVLLALVGLGIVAGVVQLIVNGLIKPSIELYNATSWPALNDWAVQSLLPVLVSLVALYFLVSFLTYIGGEIYRRTIGLQKLRKKMDAYLDVEAAQYEKTVRQTLNEISSKAEKDARASIEPLQQRLMNELYAALESRDAALDVSQRTLNLLKELHEEIEHGNPEVALEKTRELIASHREFREAEKNASLDKFPPRPAHDPDSDKAD